MLTPSPAAPADGVATIGPAIAHLMSRGPGALPAIGGAAPRAAQPFPLFSLRLDRIQNSDFLKDATPTGWRYLIITDSPIAVADLKAGVGHGGSRFHRLIRGALPERLGQAADLAEKRYESDPDHFEVRILEIPALYTTALWLHGLTGSRDIFIPLLEGNEADRRKLTEDPAFIKHVLRAAAAKRADPK